MCLNQTQMYRRIAYAEGDWEEGEIYMEEAWPAFVAQHLWRCTVCNIWHSFDEGASFSDMMDQDESFEAWLCYPCWQTVLTHARQLDEQEETASKRRRL